MNLGISHNFGKIDFASLRFPFKMSVDYIRVYQDPKNINIGCDPEGFPHVGLHSEAHRCVYKVSYFWPSTIVSWLTGMI